LAAEAVGAAIAAAEQTQADHHVEHCPQCQWVIRVPLEELKAAAPAPAPEALAEPMVAFEAPVEPVAAPAPKKPRAARKLAAKAKAAPKKKAPAKKAKAKAKPKAKAAPKKAAKKPAAKRLRRRAVEEAPVPV